MAEDGHKVTLNVYDLSQGLARQLSTTFLGKALEGIWHTGIVVYGNEYFFGGCIQQTPAGTTPYGTPIRAVDLGVTHVPQDVFEMYLQEISPRYTAETYSLLTHNCNNFSNEVSQFLVGATIPEYILQLPNEVMSSPMGALILPMIQNLETTMRAGAVPQAPQFRTPSVAQIPSTVATVTVNKSKESDGKVSTTMGASVNKPRESDSGVKSKDSNNSVKSVAPAANSSEAKEPSANGVIRDPLGDARNKVQEEIGREFAALMATGSLGASEACYFSCQESHGKIWTLERFSSSWLEVVRGTHH